jgi:hypothetical protein
VKRIRVANEIMNCVEGLNCLIAHSAVRRKQGHAKPRGMGIRLAARLMRLKSRIEKEGVEE